MVVKVSHKKIGLSFIKTNDSLLLLTHEFRFILKRPVIKAGDILFLLGKYWMFLSDDTRDLPLDCQLFDTFRFAMTEAKSSASRRDTRENADVFSIM